MGSELECTAGPVTHSESNGVRNTKQPALFDSRVHEWSLGKVA